MCQRTWAHPATFDNLHMSHLFFYVHPLPALSNVIRRPCPIVISFRTWSDRVGAGSSEWKSRRFGTIINRSNHAEHEVRTVCKFWLFWKSENMYSSKKGRNPQAVDRWLDSIGYYRKNVAYDETSLFRAASEQVSLFVLTFLVVVSGTDIFAKHGPHTF